MPPQPAARRKRGDGRYLILFPEGQLLLGLLQLLGPVHHKVDEVNAPSQRDKHQDVGDDPQADGHCPAGRGREVSSLGSAQGPEVHRQRPVWPVRSPR